jgi:hypothetical protein
MARGAPIAVPTSYAGVQFRSKLEADWAAYFDFESIQWSYEPEAFELPNGAKYLPDFYLDALDIFVEVRGTLKRSLRKSAYFVKASRKQLLIGFPQGRFLLADMFDGETGEFTTSYVDPLFDGDEHQIRMIQQTRSCLRRLGEDAAQYPLSYFANYGDSSPCYCGEAPDWFDCPKDCSRADGGDARSYYWGGMSTWGQRGFRTRQWQPSICISH